MIGNVSNNSNDNGIYIEVTFKNHIITANNLELVPIAENVFQIIDEDHFTLLPDLTELKLESDTTVTELNTKNVHCNKIIRHYTNQKLTMLQEEVRQKEGKHLASYNGAYLCSLYT